MPSTFQVISNRERRLHGALVLSNINLFERSGISNEIRVNIEDNIDSCMLLLEDLATTITPSETSIHFAQIDSTPFYTAKQIDAARYQKLENAARRKGFNIVKASHGTLASECKTCGTKGNPGGLVVDKSGALYSCLDSAGKPDLQVGHVLDGFDIQLMSSRWRRCGEML